MSDLEFSFSISGREFEIPKVIDLQLFVRAAVWDITDFKNLKPFVSILTGCPLQLLDELDDDTFNIILGVCVTRLQFSEAETMRNIGLYKLKSFDEFTFGEFIDIDLLLVSGGVQANAIELTAKIYNMPDEVAAACDVNKVIGALFALAKWRERVYLEHDEFFNIKETEDIPDEVKEVDAQALQFMWYKAVVALANENFLDINKVVERPFKEALNFLTYKKHQADKQRLEQLKRKNDLQRRT